MARDSLTVLSICAGVGGLDLAVRLAVPEARTVCYVEREAYAAAVLAARMADGTLDAAPVWDDLLTFDGRAWRGAVDLISAGLPCQPYSLAGKRRGDADERHLWPAFFRVLDEVRPALVFMENVPALLKWFRPIGKRLCELGYEFEAGIFSAAEVGAPHRRERLFILGLAKPAREQVGAAGLTRKSAELADTKGRGSRGARGRGPSQDGALGLADSEGGDGRLPEHFQRAGAESPGHSETVADPERARWPTAWIGRDVHTGREPEAGGGAVGYAASIRREGLSEFCGSEGETFAKRRLCESSGAGAWPPGPADDWSGIDPRLWPAVEGVADAKVCQRGAKRRGGTDGILRQVEAGDAPEETESFVRGVANGLAPRVDCLRAAGNGVVPLVAARAFRILAGALLK